MTTAPIFFFLFFFIKKHALAAEFGTSLPLPKGLSLSANTHIHLYTFFSRELRGLIYILRSCFCSWRPRRLQHEALCCSPCLSRHSYSTSQALITRQPGASVPIRITSPLRSSTWLLVAFKGTYERFINLADSFCCVSAFRARR